MRVVDRATFLSMPLGTMYWTYEPGCGEFGSLQIKSDLRGTSDWYRVDLDRPLSGEDMYDIIAKRELLDTGAPVPADFYTEDNDGSYNANELFAVMDADDVDALLRRLNEARADAFGAPPAA